MTIGIRSQRPQLVACVAAVLLVPGGLVVSSQAPASPPCGCSSSIGRANLDGGQPNPTFIATRSSHGVAVDAEHVYFTNPGLGLPVLESGVGRANLDGTAVNERFVITDPAASAPGGVAVDDEHIYWTNPGPSTIGRADLDGTAVEQSFITTGGASYGVSDVAVDPLHVYWTNGADAIGRANLDGTDVQQSFITGAAGPDDLAVDAGHVYWVNTADVGAPGNVGTIGRANLDGTDVEQRFITTLSILPPTYSQGGVAVDAGHIYWTNRTASTIGRANLDGTDVEQSFITGSESPEDVAVDSGHVYWANWEWGNYPPDDIDPPKTKITKGAPNKTGKTKVKFKFKSSEPDSTFECKLDRRKWKSCSSPKTVKQLDEIEHRFQVRAIDAAGNVDPSPAKDRFKVVGE